MKKLRLYLFYLLTILTVSVEAQQLAFPTATGAGAYVTGGRGKQVYIVSNLNDSGPGSLRQAILDTYNNNGGIITFSVSGTIELLSNLVVPVDNLTIAGQTAPEGGITITGKKMVFSGADNVIMRYIRLRPDYYGGENISDATNFVNSTNIILDHCSVSWGADEVISATQTVNNVTWQRTLIAEGKTGSLLGDSNNPGLSENMSFHNNLYYNITHRFPNVSSNGRVDLVNNVIFNWKFRLSVNLGDLELNQINNYYSKGCLNNVDDLVNKYIYNSSWAPEIHSAGNLVVPNTLTDPQADNWFLWEWRLNVTSGPYAGASADSQLTYDYKKDTPFPLLGNPVQVLPASEAFEDVTQNVGANAYLDENGNKFFYSDSLDELYLNNTINGDCINYDSYSSYQDYADNPHYIAFHNSVSNTPMNTGYQDSNNDGIPDAWKIAKGFDINDDLTTYVWPSGYVGIEEFLNEIDSDGTTTAQVSAGEDVSICEGESVTLTASGVESYSWSTGETGPSITVTPTQTTTYTVTGTDQEGNITTDQVTVFLNPLPSAGAGNDQAICAGESVTLTATGDGNFEWSTGETTQSITVNPTETTTYTVTVTSQQGCQASDEVIVTVNPLPEADAGPDVTVTQGENTTLTASGGDTYLWNTGQTTATINVSPQDTTTYTVTVFQNGCSDTDQVTVFVNSAVTANAGADVSICSGETVTLTASGGDSYEWSTGETTASIEVSPSETTEYTVTAFIGADQDTDAVVVTVNETPVADAGEDITICRGEVITLTASGGESYLWDTGEVLPAITVSPESDTTYTVTVSANGCQDTDTITVTVLDTPIADAGTDVEINSGDSVTLTASGGDSYLWSTGETTESITVSPTETTLYTVTVSNSNGCEDSDTVSVIVDSVVVASAGDDVTICEGESTILTATGGYLYEWSTGETGESITVSPAETTTYSVQVFVGFIFDTAEVTVFVEPAPTANAGEDVSVCSGESTVLTASGGDSYLWSNGATTQSIEVSPIATTTYYVTAFQNGCEDTDDVTVTVNSLSDASAGEDVTVCLGGSVTLTATGGENYVWSSGQAAQSITVSPTETTTYTVTVSQDGCQTQDEVTVYVNPVPEAYAGEDEFITAGETVTLTASGGGSYVWSTGETTQSIEVSPTETTMYTVTVNQNGCQDSDTVIVVVDETVMANAGNDVTICEGESTVLTASGGETFIWSTGETTQSITVSPGSTTTYSVEVFMGANSGTASVTVYVNPTPEVEAGADVTICEGDSVVLNGSGEGLLLWSNGMMTESIEVSPAVTTTYELVVFQNGCENSDTVTVTVNPMPVANAGDDVTINQGDSVTLTASGGGTYQWTTGETTQSITVSPMSTTTYSVIVSNGECDDIDDVTVNVTEVLNANAGEDQSICQGDTAVLTATGGTSYLWSTGETTQSIEVSPQATSNYTVIVSSGNESDTDEVTVFVNPLPNVQVSDDVTILQGTFVTLSASGANSYEWSNGATEPNIAVSPSITTTYSVTGFINNCSDTENITVSVLETVEANAGSDQTICLGETITLTASGGQDYLWSNGETTQSITVSPEEDTVYTVIVSNELDSDADEVMIIVETCDIEELETPTDLPPFNYQIYADGGNNQLLYAKIIGLSAPADLLIQDITGKLIFIQPVDDNNGQRQDIPIHTNIYSEGIYLITLRERDKATTKKILFR